MHKKMSRSASRTNKNSVSITQTCDRIRAMA
uniref:Uncharacterized protein n=1 Tax=Anguilla anguilla TaxID=7936 RepID=A0A0E9SX57_ANGAN